MNCMNRPDENCKVKTNHENFNLLIFSIFRSISQTNNNVKLFNFLSRWILKYMIQYLTWEPEVEDTWNYHHFCQNHLKCHKVKVIVQFKQLWLNLKISEHFVIQTLLISGTFSKIYFTFKKYLSVTFTRMVV